jgi:hypothetical protein
MCPVIDNPASCEIRAVIRFLHAKNISAAEMHSELCVVYGQNVMSEGSVSQCQRWVDQNIQNSELSCEFPKISRTVLITSLAQDGFRKCLQVRIKRREWLRL